MSAITHRIPQPRAHLWPGLVLRLVAVGGAAQVLQGGVAVADTWAHAPADGFLWRFDVTTWGWINVELGFALVATTLIGQRHHEWVRRCVIPALSAAAGANVIFMLPYPLTAMPLLALDMILLWALVTLRSWRR
jgi:hypothetical protein